MRSTRIALREVSLAYHSRAAADRRVLHSASMAGGLCARLREAKGAMKAMAKGLHRSRIVGALACIALAAVLAAAPARAQIPSVDPRTDCLSYPGDPEPGTPEWDVRDQNNIYCAIEGLLIMYSNPAYEAALAANHAQGSITFVDYLGDPFREPFLRWGGVRGNVQHVTWTNRSARVSDGVVLSPPDTAVGPFPGVLIPCHSCFTTAGESGTFWAAETLAEAGYVVFIPYVGGNDIASTVDATDYFVATPDAPTAHGEGEFNPFWNRLDRTRLGIAGHSGAGGLALNVGHTDPRYSAVVAFDPAGSTNIGELDLRKPTMVQVADYSGNTGALLPDVLRDAVELPLPLTTFLPYGPNEIRDTKPTPAPGSKYTFFDSLREAVDSMQVAIRATVHIDWGRPSGGTFSRYGEMVASYYTLAWFDRYLRGANNVGVAADALRRLMATETFDGSADVHSIGTGTFDPEQAAVGASVEAGNVPFTIEGLPVRNRLSFYYPTRYFFAEGALQCEDVRSGCPLPEPGAVLGLGACTALLAVLHRRRRPRARIA